MNWRLAAEEMLAVARDARPSALVVHSSFADAATKLDEVVDETALRLHVGDPAYDGDYEQWLDAQRPSAADRLPSR